MTSTGHNRGRWSRHPRTDRARRRLGPRRLALVVLVTVIISFAGACGGPYNTLATSDSVCFRGLPVAKTAVHDQGKLVGVKRLQTESLINRIRTTVHPSHLQLPPGLIAEGDTQLCAFAFEGTYPPGSVQGATNTVAGHYAIILVGSKHVQLLAAIVLPRLPQRFDHPHVKL